MRVGEKQTQQQQLIAIPAEFQSGSLEWPSGGLWPRCHIWHYLPCQTNSFINPFLYKCGLQCVRQREICLSRARDCIGQQTGWRSERLISPLLLKRFALVWLSFGGLTQTNVCLDAVDKAIPDTSLVGWKWRRRYQACTSQYRRCSLDLCDLAKILLSRYKWMHGGRLTILCSALVILLHDTDFTLNSKTQHNTYIYTEQNWISVFSANNKTHCGRHRPHLSTPVNLLLMLSGLIAFTLCHFSLFLRMGISYRPSLLVSVYM